MPPVISDSPMFTLSIIVENSSRASAVCTTGLGAGDSVNVLKLTPTLSLVEHRRVGSVRQGLKPRHSARVIWNRGGTC